MSDLSVDDVLTTFDLFRPTYALHVFHREHFFYKIWTYHDFNVIVGLKAGMLKFDDNKDTELVVETPVYVTM